MGISNFQNRFRAKVKIPFFDIEKIGQTKSEKKINDSPFKVLYNYLYNN